MRRDTGCGPQELDLPFVTRLDIEGFWGATDQNTGACAQSERVLREARRDLPPRMPGFSDSDE